MMLDAGVGDASIPVASAMELLQPSSITTEVAVKNALRVLGSDLENSTVDVQYIVESLLSRPHLFEFAVSGMCITAKSIHVNQFVSQAWISTPS